MEKQDEVWKDVVGYEKLYQVSNLGRVKSMSRLKLHKGQYYITTKEILLKLSSVSNEYLAVCLWKNGLKKTRTVHQLVAEAFLGHTRCGYKLVVDHINNIRTDNNINNLRITTQRINTNKKHLKSSSKYTGVSWSKSHGKWCSNIVIDGRNRFLGFYKLEIDASNIYQKTLNEL